MRKKRKLRKKSGVNEVTKTADIVEHVHLVMVCDDNGVTSAHIRRTVGCYYYFFC